MSKNVSIALGGFLGLSAVVGFFDIFISGSGVTGLGGALILGALSYWFLIVKGIKRPAPVKQTVKTKTPAVTNHQTPKAPKAPRKLETYVENANQEAVRTYITDQIEDGLESAYDGMADGDIIGSGKAKVYEATVEGDIDIELVEETEKESGESIVSVYLNADLVGTLPKKHTKRAIKFINSEEDFYMDYKILGGKYKEVVDGSVVTKDSNYTISITLYE